MATEIMIKNNLLVLLGVRDVLENLGLLYLLLIPVTKALKLLFVLCTFSHHSLIKQRHWYLLSLFSFSVDQSWSQASIFILLKDFYSLFHSFKGQGGGRSGRGEPVKIFFPLKIWIQNLCPTERDLLSDNLL